MKLLTAFGAELHLLFVQMVLMTGKLILGFFNVSMITLLSLNVYFDRIVRFSFFEMI